MSAIQESTEWVLSCARASPVLPYPNQVVTEIRIVELMDRGTVARPEGIVYSTDPQASMDEAGNQYIVKGPDLNIVVSEAIAYILAGQLGILALLTSSWKRGHLEDGMKDNA